MNHTINIDNQIDFCVSLSKNVFWVPINTLGKSRFEDAEMSEIILEQPETKQNIISNLFEAVQLFQLSNFIETDDNIKVKHDNMEWEFHKPGYFSVLSNHGCCASDTSWLLYILENMYEAIGVFSFYRGSGSGHSLNYIKHENWYYFIDLLAHVRKYAARSIPETGNMKDFARNAFSTGIFIKSKTIEDFIKYLNRFLLKYKIEHLYYHYGGTDGCIPIAVVNDLEYATCYFPNETKINIIDNNLKNIKIGYARSPQINKEIWKK